MRRARPIVALLCGLVAELAHAAAPEADALVAELVAKYGESERARARTGVAQVMQAWRTEDGDAEALAAFVRAGFAGTPAARDALFDRFQHHLETVAGHSQEIRRELNAPSDLDSGPLAPYDERFAAWDPQAHMLDDLFGNKLAFDVLLNFPLTTLEGRDRDGAGWTERQWAETLLAERFRRRIPANANQAVARAYADAGRYVAGYNLYMHGVTDARGRRLFPEGLRLLSHWNLRDEIKAQYAAGPAGLDRQRVIQRAMERIVAQEIPAAVVDNPRAVWNPFTNAVAGADPAREPDTRYAKLLANFHAQQLVDRASPSAPTHVQRAFDQTRQLSESRVRAMLESVLDSPQFARTARLVERRLGRRLEPFDIWYAGFRDRGAVSEAELDARVARLYPTAEAFQKDLPRILRALGFAPDRADYLAAHIVVEPARGSGHAMGAQMRGQPARLRTRVGPGGMDYKGYNIAIHEMCHNVEQTFSLNDVENWSLNGVPNTAFTEALAFTCQERDLELLGLARPTESSRALAALDSFWNMAEISGVALVDMRTWRWMYDHPTATPADLRAAVLAIARDVWNRWYAPVFGQRDVTLLAIYSHMINELLYLPDYPLGHLIAFQVEERMHAAGDFGMEFERAARLGAISPDLWMTRATGAPVGPRALLDAASRALDTVGGARPARRSGR